MRSQRCRRPAPTDGIDENRPRRATDGQIDRRLPARHAGALSKALWGEVTSAVAFQQAPVEQRIPPDQHIAAWRAFCQQQAAASAHRLSKAITLEAAARRYTDWRYWTWNLDQLKLEDEYQQAQLHHETEVGG
jgi:hypothetical protein